MSHHYTLPLAAIAVGVMITAVARPAAAQSMPPPIHGLTATLALPETVDAFYTGLQKVSEATGEGLERLTHKGSDSTTQSLAGSLDDLRPGLPVVVHYSVKGVRASADAWADTGSRDLDPNEGTITRVDRRNKTIALAFAGGTTQILRAADEPDHDSSRVIVYVLDGHTPGVAHYFKPAR